MRGLVVVGVGVLMATSTLLMLPGDPALSVAPSVADAGPVLVTETSSLAIKMPPQILVALCVWQVEPLHRAFLLGAEDTTTIANGTTVLFEGEVPRNLHAPNTFRDGDNCYSLNVLHVDGTRVPVMCPEGL